MLVSKPQSKLAYAKNSHHKSASALVSGSLLSGCQTPQHSKENIVDELISHLAPDQTGYLNELLQKQERRNKKGTKDKTDNKGIDSFRDKSNIYKDFPDDKKCLKMKNSKISSKPVSSSRKIKRSKREKVPFMQTVSPKETAEKTRISLPLTQNTLKSAQTSSFIDNISGYLADLARPRPRPEATSNFQSPSTSQTTQISQGQELNGEGDIIASQSEYQELAYELQEALQANELLEEALEQKEQQIQQMKQIIKKLCTQVTSLKGKLITEHKIKKNYESVFSQFTQQMEIARSSSKPKSTQKQHSSHKHLQRHSFAPTNIYRQMNPRMSEAASHQFRNTYDFSQMNKFKEESLGLKKKGKGSKYKVYNIRDSCIESSPTSGEWLAYHHQY